MNERVTSLPPLSAADLALLKEHISSRGLPSQVAAITADAPLTVVSAGAGTGKTWLAVAMAVSALAHEQVQRIILTRPAVEAGEKLGFLPGDMAQKIDPYLRPLTDALNEMMGQEHAAELVERGVIEVAPLAFMRGRTLNNAYIILDEAQNCSI